MDVIKNLPTWQYVFVVAAGSLTVITSLVLATHGYFVPLIAVVVIAFIITMTWIRMSPSIVSQPPPPEESPSQFDVFRQMEPADQTRVNPWVGFLQEDVYANRTGPIGNFVGNNDYVKNAPLYPFTSQAEQ